MHAAKGVMLAFGSRGMPTRGLRADIELSAYLVLAGQRTLTVEDLVERFLHATLPTSDGSGGQLTLEIDDGAAARDALAARARAIRILGDVLATQVDERGGEALLRDVELPLVSLLAQMERDGICLDVAYLQQVEADYASEIADAQQSAHELAAASSISGHRSNCRKSSLANVGFLRRRRLRRFHHRCRCASMAGRSQRRSAP